MLRTMAINSLRLNGIWSVAEGIAVLAHDFKGLLVLQGWRDPARAQPSGSLLIGPAVMARRRGAPGSEVSLGKVFPHGILQLRF